MIRLNKKGQGLVETVLSLPLAIALTLALVGLGYRGLVYYYAHFQLHEALICENFYPHIRCQKELEQKLKQVLLFKEKISISFKKSSHKTEGQIDIALSPALILKQSLKQRIL